MSDNLGIVFSKVLPNGIALEVEQLTGWRGRLSVGRHPTTLHHYYDGW